MESINIAGQHKMPTVKFNHLTGVLEITGRSVPDDAYDFYYPLVDWLLLYKSAPAEHTQVIFRLDYFNTATSKCLTDIFKVLDSIFSAGSDVVINWYYDDEYIQEAGEDYQAFIRAPFNLIPVSS